MTLPADNLETARELLAVVAGAIQCPLEGQWVFQLPGLLRILGDVDDLLADEVRRIDREGGGASGQARRKREFASASVLYETLAAAVRPPPEDGQDEIERRR